MRFLLALTGLVLVAGVGAEVRPSIEEPLQSTEPVLQVQSGSDSAEAIALTDIEAHALLDVEMEHFEGLTGRFTGVWFDDLLAGLGMEDSEQIRLIARDGYTVFISREDRANTDYMLVTRLEGEPLSETQLGPLLMVIPSEADGVAAGTIARTHWIWGITTLQEFSL